jgi:ferredoxin--NADP+ reductase
MRVWREKMRLQDFDTGPQYQAKILANYLLTAESSSDELRDLLLEIESTSENGQPFEFAIGQCIGVIVPGVEDIGHRHHFRMYTLADTSGISESGKPQLRLCVKRCHYIDEYSGERFDGIASNYLCDSQPSDKVTINGPFGQPFHVPNEQQANLILIGMGTGIAPFRALVKHLYSEVDITDWQGTVQLFYGAKSGLEMAYMNEHQDDFAQYYDEQTFTAIKALSPRAHWAEPVDLKSAMSERAAQILAALNSDNTYIYVAGRMDIDVNLDKIFASILGSETEWQQMKSKLLERDRWLELVY